MLWAVADVFSQYLLVLGHVLHAMDFVFVVGFRAVPCIQRAL